MDIPLLPNFNRKSLGIFWVNNYTINQHWKLSGGFRYDIAKVNIEASYDYLLAEYLSQVNFSNVNITEYA